MKFVIVTDIALMAASLIKTAEDAPKKAKPKLDLALHDAFAQTQADVHVLSGALKASGTKRSEIVDGNVWEGTIEYGSDEVAYAEAERLRGGNHDFFRNVHHNSEAYRLAMMEVFE